MNVYYFVSNFTVLQRDCFKDYVNFVMSLVIFVCKSSKYCTLLTLDLRCTALIESIYVYPNLFRHVIHVKAKYVFYTEDSMKKKKEEARPTHCNNVYATFVIVFYADCASTQYCVKHRNSFLNSIKYVLRTNAVHLWSKSLWCDYRARCEFFFLCSTSD